MKLSDLIDFNPKRPLEKGAITPFIEMADLPEGERDVSGVGNRVFNGGGSKFKNGDTLFARITPCLENGKTAKVSGLPDNAIGHGSTEFIVMAAKDPGVDEDFVYYVARHPEFRAYAKGRMEGTSGRQRVSWQAISDYEIPDFSSLERSGIGSVLSSIDNLISNNRRVNQALEAMARTLFKAWFVDFEPVRAKMEGRWQRGQSLPGLPAHLYDLFPDRLVESELGEIPEGWGVNLLGNFVTIKRGGSPRPIQDFINTTGLPWVKIADATAATSRFLFKTKEFIKKEGLSKTVLLRKGSLILSNSATPGLPIFLELEACIHDGWLYFPQKRVFSNLYLYQLFLQIREELVAQGNGSVFTNLKTDILRLQRIVVPTLELLEAFDLLAKSFFMNLLILNKESHSLAQLRDTLLPKLISGELRVPEAMHQLEAVMA